MVDIDTMEWNKFTDLMPRIDAEYGDLSVNVLARRDLQDDFATVLFINYKSDIVTGFTVDCRLDDDKAQVFSSWLQEHTEAVWTYFTDHETDGTLTEFNSVKIDQ